MTRRYYVPRLPSVAPFETGSLLPLPDDEASHASRVMRVRVHDEITIFDGEGFEASATVVELDRRRGTVLIEEVREISRMPARDVDVISCLPKPERAKEMVERLTELGVTRLVPLVAQRTQRAPTPSLLEKLRRVVIESCKQSGRNSLMSIESPLTLTDAVAQTRTAGKWIAHPQPISPTDSTDSPGSPGAERGPSEAGDRCSGLPATLLVGPEGGFTDDEVDQCLATGFSGWDFGPRIYRVETAAVVGAVELLR